MKRTTTIMGAALLSLLSSAAVAETLRLDQTPASSEEWGYRPADRAQTAVNPPSFSWRPQRGVVAWELECP